jgi:hypothetical protein
MNILSMLVRLEDALGRTNLAKQMVLRPPISGATGAEPGQSREINLVVGYNGTPNSQTALDLTLWIAHQTRLATRHQVTVQVVYVVKPVAVESSTVELPPPGRMEPAMATRSVQVVSRQAKETPVLTVPVAAMAGWAAEPGSSSEPDWAIAPWSEPSLVGTSRSATAWSEQKWSAQKWAATSDHALEGAPFPAPSLEERPFEQADRILWQARQMADEWRGSLKTHLRFGNVAQQLRRVVNAESASVLLLGCTSAEDPIIEELGLAFPCAVLGIPPVMN